MRSPIARTTTGSVSARLAQNRRVMSTSSGLASSSTVTVTGSSAMPQMGQSPGPSSTISGCMGQVYRVWVRGPGTVTGSRAMPQSGQSPGPSCMTSGCMGQVYMAPAGAAAAGFSPPSR